MGAVESRPGSGPRIFDQKQTKCLPTVYIRPTTFQVDKIKASCSKIDPLAPHPLNKRRGRKLGWDGPRALGWDGPRALGPKTNQIPSHGLHSTMSQCPGILCHYVLVCHVTMSNVIEYHVMIL